MKSIYFLFPFALSIMLFGTQATSAQVQQTLVSPYEGSASLGSYETQFTGLTMLLDPLDNKKNPGTMVREGQLISNIYQCPENISPYELYKSYLKLFSEADFDILLDCKSPDCNVKITVIST